jgi:hypothetical protein
MVKVNHSREVFKKDIHLHLSFLRANENLEHFGTI